MKNIIMTPESFDEKFESSREVIAYTLSKLVLIGLQVFLYSAVASLAVKWILF